jgi:Na+-translocating ferredoxin:NAD+ oxidoreductase RnfE subunit
MTRGQQQINLSICFTIIASDPDIITFIINAFTGASYAVLGGRDVFFSFAF